MKMETNRCVTCGAVIPEGYHECNRCFGDIIGADFVANTMLKMKLDHPVMLSFHNFDVKIENSVTLLEALFKYYIFKTNMNVYGTFGYSFVCKSIMPGESITDTEDRLLAEYTGVVNTIESMIIKK